MTFPESRTKGPTIILIGGPMTTDDGSRLDSRQPLENDHRSEVMLRCLANSLLWWRTASSLVTPILENAASDAIALLMSAQRTVAELRDDGTMQRTRLNAFLPGGTTTTTLVRVLGNERLPDGYQEAHTLRDWHDNHFVGTIGVKPGAAGKRWQFFQSTEYYLAYAIKRIDPTAIIDTTVGIFDGTVDSDRGMNHSLQSNGEYGHRFRALESTRLFSKDAVLVLPHTHIMERFLNLYSNWVAAGRVRRFSGARDHSWLRSNRALADSGGYDPDKAPDPMERTLPLPIDADFRVTGLMENARWADASHLEASRRLLQARYDLKIGLWDLARNPTLRRTLLDPTPTPAPPITTAAIPRAARQRADAEVSATLDRRAAERDIWTTLLRKLNPMIQQGWDPADKYGRNWNLRLPLTRPLPDFYYSQDGKPLPLAQLHLTFTKRKNTLNFKVLRPNLVGFDEYFHTRRKEFEAIAGVGHYLTGKNEYHCVWTDAVGWADDINWDTWATTMAQRTTLWVEEFAPIREVYERLYITEPAANTLASIPALWRRPDGSLRLTTTLRGIDAASAEMIASFTLGTKLSLRREPENSEDPNAIAVHESAGRHLGYLPQQIARLLAPLINRGRAPAFAALVSRPEPAPPSAADRRWDPILRYDEVLLTIRCPAPFASAARAGHTDHS